jgi:hypothetical protein
MPLGAALQNKHRMRVESACPASRGVVADVPLTRGGVNVGLLKHAIAHKNGFTTKLPVNWLGTGKTSNHDEY